MCNCVVCRYSRGEVSDDYYKGYLQGEVDSKNSILNSFAKYNLKPTSITENSVGGVLTCIQHENDEAGVLLEEADKK